MKKITKLLFLFAMILTGGNAAFAGNTECLGTSIVASEGSFVNGYNYSFTTTGTDVTVTFEALDTQTGLVAFLWNRTSGFAENQMTNVSGQKFSYTLTGQTLGATITVACKFAYAGGMAVTKDFTYTVGNICGGGEADTEIPTAFTATKGAVTSNSVELLLNATDNSGAIVYEITYGSTTLTTSGTSGTEKSYIVTGLTASTDYSFSIVAKDATGNAAANNPIAVDATTSVDANTECAGTSAVASDGSFTSGYNYAFTTSGTDVTVSFELLDTKVGLVAYLWNRTSGFAESQMANTSGQKFSYTLAGQTLGATITVACKFAYAGGMAVTKDFTYTVGNSCGGGEADTEIPTVFTATKGAVTSNSVELLLNATDNSGAVVYKITYGATTLNASGSSGVEKAYVVTGLTPSTDYSFSVTAKDITGNTAANSPVTVLATTAALAEPTTAAATPTIESSKAISIFSDAYTNVSGTNFNPGWGQSTAVSTIQIENNATLKYTNLNYQGTEFGSDVNASGMNYLHIDVWTPNETSLKFYLISRLTGEKYIELTPLNLNVWNNYDIPLTGFTTQGLSMADLFQFKIVGAGGNTVYIDNMYFYNNATEADTEAPTAFTATAGAITSTNVELLLKATDNSGAVNFDITYGTTTLSTVGASGIEKSYIVSGLTASTDYSFSIVAKDATGNAATNNPIVVNASTKAPVTSVPTIDYETLGQDWAWTLFENGDNASTLYAVVSNPDVTGINTSANCAKYIVNAAGQPWAGLWSSNIGEITFSSTNCIVKMMVNKNVISNFDLKFENSNASVSFEKSVPNTVTDQWEELTFDYSDQIGKTVSKIVIIPDFPSSRTAGSVDYWDNISFHSKTIVGIGQNVVDQVTISPNPVKNQLLVKSEDIISQVIIRNILGQTVKSVLVNGLDANIDLSQFSSGNYLVTIKHDSGKMSTQKIIKL